MITFEMIELPIAKTKERRLIEHIKEIEGLIREDTVSFALETPTWGIVEKSFLVYNFPDQLRIPIECLYSTYTEYTIEKYTKEKLEYTTLVASNLCNKTILGLHPVWTTIQSVKAFNQRLVLFVSYVPDELQDYFFF